MFTTMVEKTEKKADLQAQKTHCHITQKKLLQITYDVVEEGIHNKKSILIPASFSFKSFEIEVVPEFKLLVTLAI
ncbi:hypothetical protein BpHYR1_023874 [Brachionus plicatilis]|uniref:Uncharacterized protein n=1 Tax=Brachionus plicatilis TaxID=10195 RepID=A0A3M7QNA9_BRAPC|nr:hypothetical protein BpHYR1_023874 [Brachionus plicatilis]